MTELTNAIERLEAKIANAQHFGADGFTIMLDDALAIIAALKANPPVVPAAKVEAASVAKAKTVKLSAAQMKLARRMDCEATIYVPAGSALYRTAKPMWTNGLIEIVEKGTIGDYYSLTEKGYEVLHETAIANRS